MDRKDPKKLQIMLTHSAYFLNALEEMRQELLGAISYMKRNERIFPKLSMRALRKKTLELTSATKEFRACTMHVEELKKNSRYQLGDNASDA